ncbi:hypothetical protein BJX68DRAFT_168303 [Aspergillus pseudodeflectus]|uniref:Uncharacterized protein n=1 Tax=Aspergillus pseudodeflectus TaxID=176178 RepID=A0ABR4JPX7_9EURO
MMSTSTTPMTPKAQETNFVFVGGPVLTGRGTGIRSKVVQAGMRQKQHQRRKDAVAEINKLLVDRTTACSCRPKSTPLAPLPRHSQGQQPIKPRVRMMSKAQVGSVCCSFCGRYIRSYNALHPSSSSSSSSLYDIGSGLEPTIPVNETTSRLRVHEIFSFASRHVLPNLRGSLDLPDLYQTWAFPFDHDQLKLFTFLWSSKRHEGVLRLAYNMPPDPAELKEELVLKGLTLRALRKEVTSYTEQKAIDSIVRCMLVLAVNDTETATQRLCREPSPFTPTFTGLHALEFYGGRDYNRLHWENMYKLLANHEGIQRLRPFALAWQISVADLTNAAHTLRKPLYPMIDVHGQQLELDPPLVLFAPDASDDLRKPGSGFNELLLMEQPVHQRLVNVFSHVGELSYAMDIIPTQSHSPRLLELLADSRDLVHHRLFSLPNEDDAPGQILRLDGQSTGQEQFLELYLTCRLAVLLYATHVTFPIPRSSVVRSVLLHSLCPKLQFLAQQGFSSPLFLWCTSVALVALDETGPFAETLGLFQKVSRDLHITTLPSLLNLLHLFAWSDTAIQHHNSRMERYLSGNLSS